MAQIYKTFTRTDLDNKQVVAVTTTEKQQILQIVANFIQYIKDKHL
jgi:hypothetical protein